MFVETSKIIQKANRLYKQIGSRDPYRIAEELGIIILERPFQKQRGAYKVLLRNCFIFVKEDLDQTMKHIVLCHEIGHDMLHRDEAARAGGFQEFEIFNMQSNRMEYEANLFADQISLDDHDFLELCEKGYDVQQIARAMNSDINLVVLKADTLILQGQKLRAQEHRNDFLKYDW